jgi:hypothetical protein
MKVIECQISGYREQTLEDFFHSTLFPSSFFDQPVPVRGVCFAAGADSLQRARDFARNQLGLGTITLGVGNMTLATWRELPEFFASPHADVSRVGFLVPHLDLASHDVQQGMAETLLAGGGALWFATVDDHRRLIPPLKLAFLVYLGLSSKDLMRFLCQSGQRLMIDEGSLKNRELK